MVRSSDSGHAGHMRTPSQLRRNVNTSRIAGVASGLSDFLGLDATLIRVLFVLATLFSGGAAALIYLVGWLLIPPGPRDPNAAPGRRHSLWMIWLFPFVFVSWSIVRDNRTLIIAAVFIVIAIFVWRRTRKRGSWKARKEFQAARLAWQRRLDEQAQQSNHTTYLGGNPFQIDSFYPQPPPDGDTQPPESPGGFQTP